MIQVVTSKYSGCDIDKFMLPLQKGDYSQKYMDYW